MIAAVLKIILKRKDPNPSLASTAMRSFQAIAILKSQWSRFQKFKSN